jgi:hypothetical protein
VKQLFLQDSSRPLYTSGGPDGKITLEVMEKTTFSDKAPLVPGRYLLPQAKLAARNVKKAMSIAAPLVDANGDPKKSGARKEDVYKIVLDRMYELLKGRAFLDENLEGSDDEGGKGNTDDEDEANNVRPNRWFFPGWMAFVLWGTLAPPSERNALTTMGNPPASESDSKSKYSRATQKKKETLVKGEERQRGGTDRGMTVMEKIGVAKLHQVEKQLLQDKRTSRFMVHQGKVAIQRDIVDRAFKMYTIKNDQEFLEDYMSENKILKQYIKDVDTIMASPPPPPSKDPSPLGAPDSTSLLSASNEKKQAKPKPTVLEDLLSCLGNNHVDVSPEYKKQQSNNKKQQSNKAARVATKKPPPPSSIVIECPVGVRQEDEVVEVEDEDAVEDDAADEVVEVEDDEADDDQVSAGYSNDEGDGKNDEGGKTGGGGDTNSSDSSGSECLWGKKAGTINNSNVSGNNVDNNNNNNIRACNKKRKVSLSPGAVNGTAAPKCPSIFLSSSDSSAGSSGVSGGSISAASKRSIGELTQLYNKYNWEGINDDERNALLPFFHYHRLELEEAIALVEEAIRLNKKAPQKSRSAIMFALSQNKAKGRLLPSIENPNKYALSSIQLEEMDVANSIASFMDRVG